MNKGEEGSDEEGDPLIWRRFGRRGKGRAQMGMGVSGESGGGGLEREVQLSNIPFNACISRSLSRICVTANALSIRGAHRRWERKGGEEERMRDA